MSVQLITAYDAGTGTSTSFVFRFAFIAGVCASIGRELIARGVTVDLIRVIDGTRLGPGKQATR
jgi:hypothetical protein